MKRYIKYGIALLLGIAGAAVAAWFIVSREQKKTPIKIGILHSLTGILSENEKNVVDATLLAVEEINAKGGVMGRQIEPIIVDGKSDEKEFEKGALELIHNHHVSFIFGCWSSASRKRVKPIVEQENCILFYPVHYEGLEESSHIVYTGAAPNQSIIPAVMWGFHNLGKKFFLQLNMRFSLFTCCT